MSNIFLNKNNWNLEVDLNGGRIVELSYKNQKILGTFQRSDGKLGNTHLCVPNFAGEGMESYGWPFHGPFRNNQWNLINETNDSLEIGCEIDFLNVTQKFIINDKFEQKVTIENKSRETKKVNLAIHNYWDCDFGWNGLKVNGKKLDKMVGISDYIELENINEVEIAGKKLIFWTTNGFKYAKLWTCSGDQKYVCIEPVKGKEGFVESKDSEIKTGEKMEFLQSWSWTGRS